MTVICSVLTIRGMSTRWTSILSSTHVVIHLLFAGSELSCPDSLVPHAFAIHADVRSLRDPGRAGGRQRQKSGSAARNVIDAVPDARTVWRDDGSVSRSLSGSLDIMVPHMLPLNEAEVFSI